jgi:hypothetical protein
LGHPFCFADFLHMSAQFPILLGYRLWFGYHGYNKRINRVEEYS